MNIDQIDERTNDLAAKLGITDQLDGMTSLEKLSNMAVRFERLNNSAGVRASRNCHVLIALIEKESK